MSDVTMGRSSGNKSGVSSDLLVDLIETLEAQGLDREESQLYDYIDVDALEQILYSSNGNVEIQFTVEEIRLTVTPERVDVLDDKVPAQQTSRRSVTRSGGSDPGSYLNTFDDDSGSISVRKTS